MTVQFVDMAGKKMAVLPEEEYRELVELAEDNFDVLAAMRAEERAKAGEEYVPAELVNRIIDGEPTLRVWREYRGLSREELAAASGVMVETICTIEDQGGDTLFRDWRLLAGALAIDVEDIIPNE